MDQPIAGHPLTSQFWQTFDPATEFADRSRRQGGVVAERVMAEVSVATAATANCKQVSPALVGIFPSLGGTKISARPRP